MAQINGVVRDTTTKGADGDRRPDPPGAAEYQPALPPKGPPIYREPPNPEGHRSHPDICINSTTVSRLNDSARRARLPPPPEERPDRLPSRTAWSPEHKVSGKLVGEKLSSLQRKLRSFLSQSTSTKDATELESRREEPPEMHAHWDEVSRRPGNVCASELAAAFPAHRGAQHHHFKPFLAERHPFAAPSNLSEPDDATDPDQMRDTCNKFYAREQRISWTNYLNPRNSYSNNIKSSYDYDKLVPKEVIGRPSQEKKLELSAESELIYRDVTPFPSFAETTDSCPPSSEQQPQEEAPVQECSQEAPNTAEESTCDNQATVEERENGCASYFGDAQEFYKSSSESGRGTMHSSMHGSKSAPQSSGVSAASNLDTSMDSDQSVSGALWGQQNRQGSKKAMDEYQVKKNRHMYETPSTNISCRDIDNKVVENVSGDPLSLPQSPSGSAESSPKCSSRSKYKLSYSASALNGCHGKVNDQVQKICEMNSKHASTKKSAVRRDQTNCRHRSGKSQYTKSSTITPHRLGISHSNYSSRKCNSSPPMKHHSRNQLVPYYVDSADPELTSTTTGLDMESLLDDDEYSSDLSISASTMEPNEVSMIRKQLEGLETMYSEILHLLGVKNSLKANALASSLDMSRSSRRKLNGSLSSLTARSSASRGTHSFADKRCFSEKRYTKESKASTSNKRLQRLESHVVTLARSVAHLSSEMRTQHVLVEELESMRQDVTWVQERLRLMQLAHGCHPNNGNKVSNFAMPRDRDGCHKEVLELLNPSRAKKLTKFFGDEPPLMRQFLKRLGYEKYAVTFESEKIGIKELPYLTEDRLQKIGIPMGPRMRILQEAHCCPQNGYKVYIV